MPKYIALLGAINVGGHTVKMADLKVLFEQLRFSNVATFIASGNVIFDTDTDNVSALETEIEAHLKNALGYAVPTFLRRPAELAVVAEYWPFAEPDKNAEGVSLYVTFRKEAIELEAEQQLLALNSATDQLAVSGHELYWLCRTRSRDSPLASGVLIKRALGKAATVGTTRNITTVRKLAVKYAASGSG